MSSDQRDAVSWAVRDKIGCIYHSLNQGDAENLAVQNGWELLRHNGKSWEVEQLEKALTVLDQVVAAVNIGKGSFTASYGHRVSGGSQEHAPLPVDLNAIIKKETVQKFLLNRALMIATK